MSVQQNMMIMTHTIAIFILLLPCTLAISQDQAQLMNKLKAGLDILCPGVDICSPSKNLSRNVIFDSNYISCCRACSCADDCLEGTCCFNGTDSSNTINTMRTCQYPFVNNGRIFQSYVQKYYIIDSIPADGCGSTNQSCNVTPPYLWGQMLPVISTKTNLIYKNPDCAQCHGLQEDGYEKWDGELSCAAKSDFGTSIKHLEDMITERKMPTKCAIVFSYTGNRAYAATQKCYSELKNDCKNSFEIPKGLNMTQEEIKHACKYGPRSPFNSIREEPYFNIYCYLCDGGSTTYLVCEDQDGVKNPNSLHFGVLLSLEAIEDFVSESVSRPVACIHGNEPSSTKKNTSECRELLCPLGRFRDADGNCIYITKTWQDVTYVLLLDLELDETISSLLPSQTEQVPELILQIIASLNIPSNWNNHFISRVYPCDENDLSNYVNFTIGFFVEKERHYDVILATAADILSRSRIFQRKGLRVPFRLVFNRHSFFEIHQQKPLIFTPLIPSTYKLNFTKMCHKVLRYERLEALLTQFQITKLLLCDQVYITPTEFRFYTDGVQPSNILQYQNHTFFSAEFALEKKGTDEELARVCLEDSGFNRYIQQVNSDNLHFKPEPLIHFVTVMLCCITNRMICPVKDYPIGKVLLLYQLLKVTFGQELTFVDLALVSNDVFQLL